MKHDSRLSDEHLSWFHERLPVFEQLRHRVEQFVKELLAEARIPVSSVTSRVKEPESFKRKAFDAKYQDPRTEITDLVGVRIVTILESDARSAATLIRTALRVHEPLCPDKDSELGTDRVGYRSVHLVCDLGDDRLALPEYARFATLLFEIQIRSIVQHAWAEFEHDRNYKLGSVLPVSIARRVNLTAGLLEMVDRELDSIAREIKAYGESLQGSKPPEAEELTNESFKAYISIRIGGIRGQLANEQLVTVIVQELRDFGIRTLGELEYLERVSGCTVDRQSEQKFGLLGRLRDAMLYHDMKRYFESAWKRRWSGISEALVERLSKRNGPETPSYLASLGLHIYPGDD